MDFKLIAVNDIFESLLYTSFPVFLEVYHFFNVHTGQCKRTGGCYNELVVAFLRTGGGLKGKKIYTS